MNTLAALAQKLLQHKEKALFAFLTLCLVGVVIFVRGLEKAPKARPKRNKNPTSSTSPSVAQPVAGNEEHHLGSPKPLSYYSILFKGRDLFRPYSEETAAAIDVLSAAPEWDEIDVVGIFQVTDDAPYTAQIRIGPRTLFLEEGETFEEYEISRMDAIRNTVTILRREWGDSKTFRVRMLSEE